MVTNTMDKWLSVWQDNYTGKSEAAKDLENSVKKNYKGHMYIPWATMQKWFYTQDPSATIEIITNATGGHVHTDTAGVFSRVDTKVVKEKDGTTNLAEEKSEVVNRDAHSHFVKLTATFLGKTMVEVYPIQDNAYNAPNYHDSNMVNKALQRTKAKLISAITGIAYRLYEDGDLQFEDDVKENIKDNKNVKVIKPEPPKRAVVEVVEDEKTDSSESVNYPDDVVSISKYILDNKDTIGNTIRTINVTLMKTLKTSIDLETATVDSICEIISKVSNVAVFSNAIKKSHEREMNK